MLTIIFSIATCTIQPALTWFYNRREVAERLNKIPPEARAIAPLQPKLWQRDSGMQFPQPTYARLVASDFHLGKKAALANTNLFL